MDTAPIDAPRIRSIVQRLGTPMSGTPLSKGGVDVEAMLRSSREREQALDDLIKFIAERDELTAILQRYSVTPDDLRRYYGALTTLGASQWIGRTWVAASALLFPETLDFTLRKFVRDKVVGFQNQMAVAARLIQYFQMDEHGPIAD